MPIAPSHGMSQAFFARWMTRLLRIFALDAVVGGKGYGRPPKERLIAGQ
jgi:hypothetical protein